MSECFATLGPLCWTEEWKFYVWVVAQVLIWGGVIVYNYMRYRDRKHYRIIQQRVKDQENGNIIP